VPIIFSILMWCVLTSQEKQITIHHYLGCTNYTALINALLMIFLYVWMTFARLGVPMTLAGLLLVQ